MTDYDKNKESLFLQTWDVNDLYGWPIPQKLPVSNFDWIEDTSQLKEDFIKNIIKKMMKDIFLKLMFNILKNYMDFIMIYYFYLQEWKLKKSKSLLKINSWFNACFKLLMCIMYSVLSCKLA